MILKCIVLTVFNLLSMVLTLNILYLLLPDYLIYWYYRITDLLLFIIVVKLIFGLRKKIFLRQKVETDGKAVLITGCARGIGNALAKHLDSKGFRVFASCLNPNSPGADDLRRSCSSRLEILQLDVTKDRSVEEAVEFVKNNLGTSELWAIINNAGIQKGYLIELSSIQDFKDSIDVNVIGQVRVTKAFLPLLRKSKGRVINISSILGRVAFPFIGPYTISKFASVGLSEYLQYELDLWGIKVISIEPEFFETDMTNPNLIMKRVDDTFASMGEEVRRDYGEKFLEALKMSCTGLCNASPKVQKILDATEHAVRHKDPNYVYIVSRNILNSVVCIWNTKTTSCEYIDEKHIPVRLIEREREFVPFGLK